MSDQILVPYDGSAPSRDALEYTFEKFPDGDVTALYVVPTPDGYWTAFEEPAADAPGIDEAHEHGEDILDEAVEIATDHDRSLETELAVGKPHHEIVDSATDAEYEMIVIGSHGREGISRILLGSVAETVVRRAPIPVVVVR